MEQESKFKLFSLGVVVEDKEENSDYIKVTPIEQMSTFNGSLADISKKYQTSLPNAQGVQSSDQLEGDVILVAKWLPLSDGNRITAPDVRRSETVRIFRFADTDDFYWATFFREPKLRRQETAHYAFSNQPGGIEPFNKESSYWFEVSTKHKYLRLHTAKNDGEPFSYDLQIDTGRGNVELADDNGNSVVLDSKNDALVLTTNAGAVVELREGNITLDTQAGASVTLKDGDIILKCKNLKFICDSFSSEAGGVGTMTLEATNIALVGGTITANGEDLTTDLT